MPKLIASLAAAALIFGGTSVPASAAEDTVIKADVDFVMLDKDITVRRMVARTPDPKGVVLLLHGFPETLYVWQDVSSALAGDYEVHAFDWPGYGQSSRPATGTFAYGPRDYARVLIEYIDKAGIDRSKLTIYATDIAGLPALLAALEQPDIARSIIVGDFAPFDRPAYMQERLQALKDAKTGEAVRGQFNATRDEILENAMRRGLTPEEQFEITPTLRADMAEGWNHGAISTADAFAFYYSQFTRDQNYLEANLARLGTPVRVVWGGKDVYMDKAMGVEFAARVKANLTVLPGVGHYPHLQKPALAAAEIRSTLP
jgi:pimeloyl-ACP methyl ester carboxylesterase